MTIADELIEKIFSWLDKQEQCAEKLEELAAELESHRKSVQITQVVGSSVSVAGALALTAAGILTFFTGGLAAPLLFVAGSVIGGLGTATNLTSDIVEAIMSSSTMKDAKKISEESERLMNEIQELMELLVEEGEKQRACVCTKDSVEDYLMDHILKALAERSGLKWNSNYKLLNTMSYVTENMGSRVTADVLQAVAWGLPLLSDFVIALVSKKILKKAGVGTGRFVFTNGLSAAITSAETEAPMAMAQATAKATAKGAGRLVGGVVGLVISVPELVMNSVELANSGETEASHSLRDAAKEMKTSSEQMRSELDRVREVFERLAKVNRCIENPESDSEERKELTEFAKENCKDEATRTWLQENSESEIFIKLLRMFRFLKTDTEKEEKEDHSEDIDIIFVARGSIRADMISASRLRPVETVRDVVLYSPWNCVITAEAAYGVAAGDMKPQDRIFGCRGNSCSVPSKDHQPTNLPNHWNSMKKAGDQQIPNIMLSPVGPEEEDGAWKRFKNLKIKHGFPERNRIVVPYILPGQDGSPSSGRVPFFIVTLALSLVLIFSRFRATVHLAACLGKSSGAEKFDEAGLKRQYAYTIDNTYMTVSTPLRGDSGLYRALKSVFD